MDEQDFEALRWYASSFPAPGRQVAFVGSRIAVRRNGSKPRIFELEDWKTFLAGIQNGRIKP